MDSRDLTYVLTVRDTQNFSKAAQRLFISQPSLSAAVKKAAIHPPFGTALG